MEIATGSVGMIALSVYAAVSLIGQVIGFMRSRKDNELKISQEAKVLFKDVKTHKNGQVSLIVGTDEGVFELPKSIESIDVFDSLSVPEDDEANIKVTYRARYSKDNNKLRIVPIESLETL